MCLIYRGRSFWEEVEPDITLSFVMIHAHFGASGVCIWVDWQTCPPEQSATFTTADDALTSIPRFSPHFPVAFLC